MSEIKARTIEEIPYYQGPNAVAGIRFRTAGRELGVTAWGMNVLEIEPGCAGYPEHDHVGDAQEEVYVVLRGDGTLDSAGDKIALTTGMLVRVGPSKKRKFLPGSQGITLLAVGATPGQAYRPRF
jgi:uncharacterized cupin superfamily protein